MTTEPAAVAPRLSDADLVQFMELIRGADSVELKLTVPTGSQRATVAALPIDPVEAQPRQVFFFDTPDLSLNKAGVVVRARRIQGGRGDTVVKLRPVDPGKLPADLRRQAGFVVEVDAMPGGFVCSGSYKGRATGPDIRAVVEGKASLRQLFSKDQRAYFKAHAPDGIQLDGLSILGPIFILKSAFQTALVGHAGAPERRMVAEMWLYPDGSRILEISLKCLPADAFQVAAETRAYLAAHGVIIEGDQQTKTRAALEFFRAEAEAQAGAAAHGGEGGSK
jgi:hypothetical protein